MLKRFVEGYCQCITDSTSSMKPDGILVIVQVLNHLARVGSVPWVFHTRASSSDDTVR